jgi:undecaprenyl-diphosphatase
MKDFFYSIDVSVFYFFNHTLSNKAFDNFFSSITNVNNWYIAYIILWCILFFNGGKKGKIAAILVLLLITATDQIGFKILKEYFARIRPCNVLPNVLTPLGCNGTYSFPSNHALNNFAGATFFYRLYPKLKWILFIIASLIAISRIYLGLHYPSDVLGGAIIGVMFGYLFSLIQIWLEKIFEKKSSKS